MKVDVDVSDVVSHGHAAARAHRSFPRRMLTILRGSAAEERRTHTYTNRSGDLESGTQAVVVGESTDSVTIDLTMGEAYASYVVKRGFSDIKNIEARAEQVLANDVGDMGAKVGGGT